MPTPSEVAAAERAYAHETRRLGASIAAWEGENAESEWMYLDADMCERHADIVEAPDHPDSYEAYMHIVSEYQAALDEGAPASGMILYLPHKYIEQLNERLREMVDETKNDILMDEQAQAELDGWNSSGVEVKHARLLADYSPTQSKVVTSDTLKSMDTALQELETRNKLLAQADKLFEKFSTESDLNRNEIETEQEVI